MILLRTDHLYRSFGSLVVTNDVNLTVEAGERHVIIGPNGAGKTSLINQIGGQLEPSAGRFSSRTPTSPAGRRAASAAWALPAPSSATTCSRISA
jgi:ABC-type branched-subunit amino acid transport system ATPase component